MQLRDYQREAVERAVSANVKRVCIVAPTGAGKTVIGAAIASHFGGNVLWVSHTEELDRQAMRRLPSNAITTTVQKMLAREHFPDVSAVIIDECHHYVADSWNTILSEYPDAMIYGLTATPQRGDGVALGNAFDQLIVAANYSRLLEDEHLVPCEIYSGTTKRLDPIEAYKRYVNGQTAFVYVSQVNEAERLAHEFNMNGISADFIGANTDKTQRKHIIARFDKGEIKVLTNVYTLTEGVDIPRASACIIARNITHVGTYLQIAGRVLRPYPGKTKATIIDLPGVYRAFGPPTMDREYSLSGCGIQNKSISVTTCLECGRAYESGPLKCPGCGHVKLPQERKWNPVWSEDLKKVYDGKNTPIDAQHTEFLRLNEIRKSMGKHVGWLVFHWMAVFEEQPPLFLLPEGDKVADYRNLIATAKEKGYRPGWASYLYKSRYGTWPRK